MFAAVFVRPDLREADFAVLFLHNEGYSTMCGHAVIALGRYAAAVRAAHRLDHPDDEDLAFLYGTILTDGGTGRDLPSRNLCVFAEREVDRSPTGSGVSARMALAAARGEAAEGEEHRFESVTGSVFSAAILEDCVVGERPAVRVRVGGKAHYTGACRFTHEPDDDLGKGFVLR